MKRCRQARQLIAYAEDRLPLERALAFEEHMRACDACRAEWQRQQDLEEILLSLPRPCLDVEDRKRLLGEVHAFAARESSSSTGRKLVIAAAVLVMFVAGFLLVDRGGSVVEEPSPIVVSEEGTASRVPDVSSAGEAPSTQSPPSKSIDDRAILEVSRDERARRLASHRAAHERLEVLIDSRWEREGPALVAELAETEGAARVRDYLRESLAEDDERRSERALALYLGFVRQGERLEGVDLRALGEQLRGPLVETAFSVLVEAETPDADAILISSVQDPGGQTIVLEKLARLDTERFVGVVERELFRRMRSRKPADRALVESCVAGVRCSSVDSLRLLVQLWKEGLSRESLESALDRLEPDGVLAIDESLRRGRPLARDEALEFVILCPRPDWIDAIASLVLGGRDKSRALDALAAYRDGESLPALVALGADVRLSARDRELVTYALGDAIATAPVATVVETLASLGSIERARVFEVCAALARTRGREVLLATVEDRALDETIRADACRHLPALGEPPSVEALAQILSGERGKRTLAFVSSMLLTLHDLDSDRGVHAGLRSLDVDERDREGIVRRVRRASARSGRARPGVELASVTSYLASRL